MVKKTRNRRLNISYHIILEHRWIFIALASLRYTTLLPRVFAILFYSVLFYFILSYSIQFDPSYPTIRPLIPRSFFLSYDNYCPHSLPPLPLDPPGVQKKHISFPSRNREGWMALTYGLPTYLAVFLHLQWNPPAILLLFSAEPNPLQHRKTAKLTYLLVCCRHPSKAGDLRMRGLAYLYLYTRFVLSVCDTLPK